MVKNTDILRRLFNVFDPFRPLPAGDPAYVECREVRGDGDILMQLGKEIEYADRMTCQLYAGHRGAGKSTELRRLQQYLDNQGFFVVYFDGDDQGDIDPEDVQYTDILLACTRHLLEALKDNASPRPLLDWLKNLWEDLKDLAQTEVSLESLSIEGQISQFGKLTANLKAEPSLRRRIRERINPHTTTLTGALNQFINEAKKNLPTGYSQLVVIADSLDRIARVIQEDGRSSHDHIFIDRSEQLKKLDCHVVYTVPISMVYSDRATDIRDIYGTDSQVLPMIMVQTPDNQRHELGINKVKELIAKRISQIDASLSLEPDIFAESKALEGLCLLSGGHVRNLLSLMKEAIKYTDSLPIPSRAIQRSISEARNTYRNNVYDDQWQALARVYLNKQIIHDEMHRSLLFSRCILEYRCLDAEGEVKCWYDVHPLLKGTKEFQDNFAKIQP